MICHVVAGGIAVVIWGVVLAFLRSTLGHWELEPEILLLRDKDPVVQALVRLFTVALILLAAFGAPCG